MGLGNVYICLGCLVFKPLTTATCRSIARYFDWLSSHGVAINFPKWEIEMPNVASLGHISSSSDIYLVSKKVTAIQDFLVSTIMTVCRRFVSEKLLLPL